MKVKGSVLAEALRRAGLRGLLGGGMTRHSLADAAEALLVYAWLCGFVSLDEGVALVGRGEDLVEGLSLLLREAGKRVTFV